MTARPEGAARSAEAASARSTWYPPAPQVLADSPPGVLSTPRVIPVYFGDQPYRAQIQSFFENLGASSYWAAATSEYGVGPLTVGDSITLPTTLPPLDGVGAYDWLTTTIATFPTPAAGDIFSFVIPPLPPGDPSADGLCTSYGGYHTAVTLPSGQNVAATFIGSCHDYLPGLVGIDSITVALSHELVESVTDPLTTTAFGFIGTNWQGSGWAASGEGTPSSETADMCEFQPDANVYDPAQGFTVQRIWSNKAAAGWHDPCVPAPARTFFSAQPILGGIRLGSFPANFSTGVNITPGGETTIPVRLFADGPMSAWTLSAVELPNPHLTPDNDHLLSFSWDQTTGRAGDLRHLTIKRAVLPPGEPPPFLRVAIESTSGATTNVWWLVVAP